MNRILHRVRRGDEQHHEAGQSTGPAAGVSAGERVVVEVVTTSGRGVRLEFRVRADSVEVWHHEHLASVLDRQVLAQWLRHPGPALVVDELELTVDWQVDSHGRVAVTLPDVNAWTLSPAELDTLYRRVVDQERR